MVKTTLKFIINQEKNSITFSKNFRIFSTNTPISGISELVEFVDDVIISSPEALDLSNLTRQIRYSRNKLDWSLWYTVSPTDLSGASGMYLEKDSEFYFEVKYKYDDGTKNELSSIIQINEIKLRFTTYSTSATITTYTPEVSCSDEKCVNIVANTDPSFRPYEVNSAVQIYQDMSYFTNQLYGHQVVYFRTVPESGSGDYIFKEWTLYKNVDRKCLKVMVPKNVFPSNAPKYTEYGMDFQFPFEIHLDHKYFQSIFGVNSEPRKRDFLFFPLIDRMFEVQGSYLNRGFMMSPTFWKVQLKKYNPNIDTLLTDDTRHFLDNVINTAEQLFGEQVEDDIQDATMPQQYQTISTTFDPSRAAINHDLKIKPLKYTYNYSSLIENYYNLSEIPSISQEYSIISSSPANSQDVNIVNLQSLDTDKSSQFDSLIAYEGSDVFTTWKNSELFTGDKVIKGSQVQYVKVRGPFDTLPDHIGQSETGRYIRLDAYRDLSYTRQRDINYDVSTNKILLKTRDTSVIYSASPVFNSISNKNLSYTCLFNVQIGAETVNFLDGYDSFTQSGIRISGQYVRYFQSQPEGDLVITLTLNTQIKQFTIPNFNSGIWCALVISASNEFKQSGCWIYSIKEDPADIINHTDFIQEYSNSSSILPVEFNLTQKYSLPTSNILISNIRLFNTMLKEEDHDFILSQQFIKDESSLIIIDNCRPQLNIPYISKNR